ncbi:hypothetical protein P3W85_30145 [Cupriavidus basilensis]|uniref:Uncharacterized protein n=1 Tax=Cupriavidus basilensis TaxID=68895 RepID=A0ABT6AX35_9BURK|nr:hypothetical protein [Cupriavidus basilensis]MDF3837185.1 hypothetical protein [Cupriavidus basilensis]
MVTRAGAGATGPVDAGAVVGVTADITLGVAAGVIAGAARGTADSAAAAGVAAGVTAGAGIRSGTRFRPSPFLDGTGATAGGAVTGAAGKSAAACAGACVGVDVDPAATGGDAVAAIAAATRAKQPAASSSSMEMPSRSIWTRIHTIAATFLTSAGTEERMAEDTINADRRNGARPWMRLAPHTGHIEDRT